MNNKIEKNIIIDSMFWKILERIASQGIQFIIQIILARLLFPEEYGLLAIVLIFINIANIFVQGGLNTALIQKQEVETLDYSSVFAISFFISILLYLVLYFSAPFISSFYNEDSLTKILRVIGLTLIVGSVQSIQTSIIMRNMMFKKLFNATFVSALISGSLGIILALNGYGIWSLVWQYISAQLVLTFILTFSTKWRFSLKFSKNRFKSLFDFGSKILATNLLNSTMQNIQGLIIGKKYSPESLGYYNRGRQFPALISDNLDGSIQAVMFPAYSSHQENKPLLKTMLRKSIIISATLIFPIMIGFIVTAEPIIILILTEKWRDSIIFLRIFSIAFMFNPIFKSNLQALKAMGQSGLIFRLELIKKSIEVIVIIIAVNINIEAIAVGVIITSFFGTLINLWPNKQILNYGYKEQFSDIFQPLMNSIIMGIIVYPLTFIKLPNIYLLFLQVVTGVVIYLLLNIMQKSKGYRFIIDIIKIFFKKSN